MNARGIRGWLLDTHTLLWMIHGDRRLSKSAARAIDGGIPVYHSSASFWEIAIKLAGKGFDFVVEDDWHLLYPEELRRIGVPLLIPDVDDFRLLQDLPKHHGDPFDRILVCQSQHHGLGILSADAVLDDYGVQRVW